MALEDGSWAAAQDFFDRVLDMNAECAEAYLGKFLAGKREKGLMQYTASQVSRAKQQEKSVPKEAAQPDAAASARRWNALPSRPICRSGRYAPNTRSRSPIRLCWSTGKKKQARARKPWRTIAT